MLASTTNNNLLITEKKALLYEQPYWKLWAWKAVSLILHANVLITSAWHLIKSDEGPFLLNFWKYIVRVLVWISSLMPWLFTHTAFCVTKTLINNTLPKYDNITSYYPCRIVSSTWESLLVHAICKMHKWWHVKWVTKKIITLHKHLAAHIQSYYSASYMEHEPHYSRGSPPKRR